MFYEIIWYTVNPLIFFRKYLRRSLQLLVSPHPSQNMMVLLLNTTYSGRYLTCPGNQIGKRKLMWVTSIRTLCVLLFWEESSCKCLFHQYHSCWWPGNVGDQGISRHGIDLVSPDYAMSHMCVNYYWQWNTVRCCYNMVNFLQNPHNRHPIARPSERDMGRLLWF